MKEINLILLFCLPNLALEAKTKSIQEREFRIVIESEYKRSKKIWGTYGQTSEKTSLSEAKKTLLNKSKPVANMMLKNGEMILIRPVKEKGLTSYKVKKFPYKKIKGKKYKVSLQKNRKDILAIYKENLLAILKKKRIEINSIDWNSLNMQDMRCRSRKSKFNCKIPIILKTLSNRS